MSSSEAPTLHQAEIKKREQEIIQESHEVRELDTKPVELQEELKHRWDNKMIEMMKPDIYGYILDDGIRETVVAMQLLGFNTTQSDQGNYGNSPWVQFEADPPKDIYVGEQELKTSIMAKLGINPNEINPSSPFFGREKQVNVEEGARKELAQANALYTQEYKKWHEETITLASKLQDVISEFYKPRLDNNQGGDLQVCIKFPYRDSQYAPYIQDIPFLEVKTISDKSLSEEEEIAIRMKNEMKRFTEFLKEKFFSNAF